METQERILIKRGDDGGYGANQGLLVDMARHLQGFVNEFNTLEIGCITTKEQLHSAWDNPQQFYKKQRLDSFEMPEMFKVLGWSKERVDENRTELPSPQNFYNLVEDAKAILEPKGCGAVCYHITDGRVDWDKIDIEAEIEKRSIYATTEKEIALYNSLNLLSDAFNDVLSKYRDLSGNIAIIEVFQSEKHKADAIMADFIGYDKTGMGTPKQWVSKAKPSYKLFLEAIKTSNNQ